MIPDTHNGASPPLATSLLVTLALVKLLLHLYTNAFAGYGIFRDELYYLACANMPAMGYVDHPPLSILILAVIRTVLGDSIFALRLLPAIAGGTTIVIAGMIARELNGRTFAQFLAALTLLAAPIKLGMDSFYSMNTLDHLLWALALLILVRVIKRDDPRQWLLLGVTIGLGAMNKISMLWLVGGIFFGLMLTPSRELLRTRWPWVAGAVAFVLFLPFIIWNVMNDFAHLEFIRNATANKYGGLTPLSFLADTFMSNGPANAIVWGAGLVFFFTQRGKRFRPAGIAFVTTFIILIINIHSKAEYLSPALVIFYAGGGVAFERLTAQRFRIVRGIIVLLVVLFGVIAAPFALPILPVEDFIVYSKTLGIAPSSAESKEVGLLPQHYADRFGWEEKAKAVADAYHTLSPQEQAECAIFADNYGRSAAVDYYAAKFDLPRTIGRHNNYWLWGPREYTGSIVLVIGGDLEGKQRLFEHVEIVSTVTCTYCMPYESNVRVYLCRGLKQPLAQLWPSLKHFH